MTEILWFFAGAAFGAAGFAWAFSEAKIRDCPSCRELEARRACMRWARRALQVALSKLPPSSPANRAVMKQAMMALGEGHPKLWMYREKPCRPEVRE